MNALTEAKCLAREGLFTELQALVEKHRMLLQEVLSQSEPPNQIETNFINTYIQELQNLEVALEELPTIQSKVHQYVVNCLPTFIYMDDYKTFTGTAYLNDIKTRWDEDRETEEDETFLTNP